MKIILYSQEGCPMCKTIKMLLIKKSIDFEICKDLNIMKSKGINHTPTLEVDGDFLTGKPMIDWVNSYRG